MKDVMLPIVVLPQSCAGCGHYDGDHHCALLETGMPGTERGKLIHGYIEEPHSVVCVKWTKPEPEAN